MDILPDPIMHESWTLRGHQDVHLHKPRKRDRFQQSRLGTSESDPRDGCCRFLSASGSALLSHNENTMFRKRLKTIVFISICVVSLLSGVLLIRTQTPADPTPKENRVRTTQRQTVYRPSQNSQATGTDFQTTKFYRTIVDNNLFRPLGWTLPRPRNPYRLLGTRMPTDGKSKAQAILQSTTAGRTHTVSLGEMLSTDTTLVDIQPKQITLETAGVQRTLHLNTTPLLK